MPYVPVYMPFPDYLWIHPSGPALREVVRLLSQLSCQANQIQT